MKRLLAIRIWNAAIMEQPIGVDESCEVVTPMTTFGLIVSSHIPEKHFLLNIDQPLPNTHSSRINSEVSKFLRDMADAIEGKINDN